MDEQKVNGAAVIMVPIEEWNTAMKKIDTIHTTLEQMGNAGKKELLTPKEVCEILKIGRTTFDRYVNEGRLTPARISQKKYSKIYISRSEIEKMLDDCSS